MSILKVDQIQLSNGNTPTAGDLGINDTGTVLQVVHNQSNSANAQTTSTSYVSWGTAPQAAITPKATNSKILILAQVGMQLDASGQVENTIERAISGGASSMLDGGTTYGLSFHGTSASGGIWKDTHITRVDTPNTTSAVTYKWYGRSENGANVHIDHGGATNSMVLIEIAG